MIFHALGPFELRGYSNTHAVLVRATQEVDETIPLNCNR